MFSTRSFREGLKSSLPALCKNIDNRVKKAFT